eukprot:6486391-Amphidinium_carterae.1
MASLGQWRDVASSLSGLLRRQSFRFYASCRVRFTGAGFAQFYSQKMWRHRLLSLRRVCMAYTFLEIPWTSCLLVCLQRIGPASAAVSQELILARVATDCGDGPDGGLGCGGHSGCCALDAPWTFLTRVSSRCSPSFVFSFGLLRLGQQRTTFACRAFGVDVETSGVYRWHDCSPGAGRGHALGNAAEFTQQWRQQNVCLSSRRVRTPEYC